MPETFVFYAFSAVAIGASTLVIGQRNPMYSVMLLIASFGALSGLYIQLDAPFVAVAQIIIYAGAIMVLFLFVVMLLNAPREDAAEYDRSHPLRASQHRQVRRAAGDVADRAAGLGAGEGCRAQGACRLAQRCRIGRLGRGDGSRALYPAHVRVRGHVGADSGRDGRCRGARPTGRQRPVIPLSHYLIVSAVLFAIGTAGVFLRRNLITILLSIEIMLNAVNLTFVAFGRFAGDVDGQIITFFVMTVAAAEAAVGLALVIALFRHRDVTQPGRLHLAEMVRCSR